jgi:phosphatidate phosphatase APP1
MSDAYRRWESQGASFHYVSGSPWQLFEPLRDLLREAGFPRGSMDMRTVRLRQLRLVRFGRARAESVLGPPTDEKRAAIREILETFPARRFVLCGDTGEEDPELYGELAGTFPRQILRVFLRNVSSESAGNQRIGRAFADAEPGICRLFADPAELPLALL